ncbi:hypothetical protein DVH05_004155 [Phytophthora capsici]|nr:hypothetical protein DVH05_004155 [Phytophthora capsici]
MAMQYLNNLAKTCKDGMQCYSWVMNDVDGAEDHKYAAELGKRILNAWPYEKLPGFSFDLGWSHLYSARARCWYNDNLIYAFMVVLGDQYSNNATIFLPQLSTPTADKGNRIPASTLDLVAGAEKDIIFMPMNLNGTHWVCLVVDKIRTTIHTYDSFDKRATQNLLCELAEELNEKCFPEKHRIVAVHSPIQKDGYNCGLFVCLYFWRRLFKDAGNDYTSTGLQRRRWDVFRSVVEFSDLACSNKSDVSEERQ